MNENLLQVEDFEKFSRLIELTQTFMGKAYTDGVVKVQFDALSIAFIEIQTDLIFWASGDVAQATVFQRRKLLVAFAFAFTNIMFFNFKIPTL